MSEMLNELYKCRVLIFFEDAPQSNKYHQVILNKEQFKKVSFAIFQPTGLKCLHGHDQVNVEGSDEIYNLPDLKETNEF